MQTCCDASFELYQPYAVRDWAAPFLISEEVWKKGADFYKVFRKLSFGNWPELLWGSSHNNPGFFIFKKGAVEYGVKSEESNEFQINENQTQRASMQAMTSTELGLVPHWGDDSLLRMKNRIFSKMPIDAVGIWC